MKLKIKCPAKINLTLKVFPLDEKTGFHPIESVMQAISLYDYLTVEKNHSKKITLNGNSKEITYDENNLIIKAANAFFEAANIQNEGLDIYLEKNIPVAAGLAGGSTDAAGVIFALNYIYKDTLSVGDIFKINAALGSDINFCYKGGIVLAKGKGDELSPLEFVEFPLSLIKPSSLKISTKEAYLAYDLLKEKSTMPNDLEFAMVKKYDELKFLHDLGFQMSGSGPSFFIKKPSVPNSLKTAEYQVFENLSSIANGVCFI